MVSIFGTWMQVTAQGFLVFELTHSSAYLGYVGFAAGVPSWLLMLYGGAVADRMARRSMLIATQGVMMALAVALAVLSWTGHIEPWHIVILALGGGIANAFDGPARQAFVLEMVNREDLTNAIALNSTVFNLATTLGPALAGMVYAAAGPAWCFVINALSFVGVLGALALMRLAPEPERRKRGPVLGEVIEGLRYVARHEGIRVIMVSLGLITLFGFSMVTLIPAWAVRVLHGDAETNGLLLSARGLGSLAGALFIASRARLQRRGLLVSISMLLLPILLVTFAALHDLFASLVLLVILGLAFMVAFNLMNALVQTLVPDELRGRVMSLYTLTFFGLMPLGALLAGTLAEHLGEPLAIGADGVLLLVVIGVLWRRFAPLRALG